MPEPRIQQQHNTTAATTPMMTLRLLEGAGDSDGVTGISSDMSSLLNLECCANNFEHYKRCQAFLAFWLRLYHHQSRSVNKTMVRAAAMIGRTTAMIVAAVAMVSSAIETGMLPAPPVVAEAAGRTAAALGG